MTVIHIIYGLQFHLHTYTKFRFAQPTVCFDKYIKYAKKKQKRRYKRADLLHTQK